MNDASCNTLCTGRFRKADLMCYMENALDSLPERDSSGSRNASSGPMSCLSGSVTPTEEIQYVSNQQQHTDASSPRGIASNRSSSETKKQWTSSDFDVIKRRKEEELQQNTYERQRKKSGCTSKVTNTKSPSASRSRVSFESDLSVATPGIPPLDLSTPASSVDTTSVSSCGATPDPSPRRALVKYRPSDQREIVKNKQHNGSSSVVEKRRKDSSAGVLHANISIRDKRKTNRDTNQKRYYNMDMNVLTTSTMPANENSPNSQSLKRVNSESYLPTPEAARHEDFSVRGATSLHDIRYVLDDIVSPLHSLSREDFTECSRSLVEESSTERENPQRKSRLISELPSKYQSMPNVDAIESIRDDFYSKLGHPVQKFNLPQVPVVRDSRQYLKHDSSDSLLSDTGRNLLLSDGHGEQSAVDSTRILPTRLMSEHNMNGSQVDLNISDTDSTKSYVSTSSMSSFRHAISAKMNTRYQASGPLRSKPMNIPDAAAKSNDASRMNTIDFQTVQRPIAMVTRHTQMPSPGPQKMTVPRRK